MNKLKKVMAGMAAVFLLALAGSSLVIPASADETHSLLAGRETYYAGDMEDIQVVYRGSQYAKDWIAIYPKNGTKSIFWFYTGSAENGTTNFQQDDLTVTTSGFNEISSVPFDPTKKPYISQLPTGEYDVRFFENDGYTEVAGRAAFKVVEKPLILPQKVLMSKDSYIQGEMLSLQWEGANAEAAWVGIYKKGDIPGNIAVPSLSMLWNYTGATSGSTDFMGAPGAHKDGANRLPAGEYVAYLFNESYDYGISARYAFRVTEPEAVAPQSVTYNRTATQNGLADGTVTITAPAQTLGLTGYALYWGDDDGPFEDYRPIPVSGEGTVTHTLYNNTVIPSGATKLYAYSVYGGKASAAAASATLPANAALTAQPPLYGFHVLSDTHILAQETSRYNKNFEAALQDILDATPDSKAVIHVGDITDHGQEAEYAQYQNLLDQAGDKLPPVYTTPGNHDRDKDDFDTLVARYKAATGASSLYYAQTIEGYRFIFLGSESNATQGKAYYSQAQLDFLKKELSEAAKGSKPIFVYMHEPMDETTAGTVGSQNWSGCLQEAEIEAILDEYPQAVLFNGHTHWTLDSPDNMYGGNGTAAILNTAAIAYVWDDDCGSGSAGYDRSEGYYVEVYADKVVLRGRDFGQGKWIPNAYFMLDTAATVQTMADGISREKEGLIGRESAITQLLGDIEALPSGKQAAFAELKAELTALKTEIAALKKQVSDLEKAIGNMPDAGDVTIDDFEAVANAQKLYAGMTEEQKGMLPQALTAKLDAAVQALGLLTGLPELKEAVEEAGEIDLDQYADGAAKTAFVKALEEAKAMLEAGISGKDEVTAARNALAQAVAGLKKKADMTALTKLVEEAEAIDLEAYSESAAAALKAALDNARSVLEDQTLSVDDQETVDKAAAALKAAVDTLKTPDNPVTGIGMTVSVALAAGLMGVLILYTGKKRAGCRQA